LGPQGSLYNFYFLNKQEKEKGNSMSDSERSDESDESDEGPEWMHSMYETLQ
jgi:hypothetical protein